MFEIIDKDTDLTNLSIVNIFDNVYLTDFLTMNAKPNKTILCPVYAIDIENKMILQDKCISCGICFIKNPKIVSLKNDINKISFLNYCKKDKMFVYKWLSLMLNDNSGINIKSRGFSRSKRIPLIIKNNDILFLGKSIHNVKDLESANYELDDIIELSRKEINNLTTKKIIIILDFKEEDKKYLKKIDDVIFLSIDKLYDNFIFNNINTITCHIKQSGC